MEIELCGELRHAFWIHMIIIFHAKVSTVISDRLWPHRIICHTPICVCVRVCVRVCICVDMHIKP